MSTTATATRAVTADNVIRLFPEVDASLASSHRKPVQDNDLEGYDEEQIRLMEEVCIVLDRDDNPIGSASKKVCACSLGCHWQMHIDLTLLVGHLTKNIDQGLLHRAFSVFLFDSQNRLLLQQRASEKITFPDMWTNTCCSHPLGVPGETGAELDAAVQGVRRAAQRKLGHELGIKPEQVPLEKFEFLTRIHYMAPSDGKWGEHESRSYGLWLTGRPLLTLILLVDYILFIKANVDLTINPNEVRDSLYISEGELKTMFKDNSLKFTPWFKLICQSMLFEWWEHLDEGLDKYKGEKQIRRM